MDGTPIAGAGSGGENVEREEADDRRRCPVCGALVGAGATWCGQCLTPLSPGEDVAIPAEEGASTSTSVPTPAGDPGAVPRPDHPTPADAPHWPCPICGTANPVALDACATCGTSFVVAMRHAEQPARVEPKDAIRASLLYPGLGHRRAGRPGDGLARGVLFTFLLAMTLVMAISGVGSTMSVVLLALFGGATVAVYLGSAWEAGRIAAGGRPALGTRAVLWITVAMVLVSIGLLTISVLTASGR